MAAVLANVILEKEKRGDDRTVAAAGQIRTRRDADHQCDGRQSQCLHKKTPKYADKSILQKVSLRCKRKIRIPDRIGKLYKMRRHSMSVSWNVPEYGMAKDCTFPQNVV